MLINKLQNTKSIQNDKNEEIHSEVANIPEINQNFS